MKKIITITIITGIFSGVTGAYLFEKLQGSATIIALGSNRQANAQQVNYHGQMASLPGFVEASAKATPSVVFIKTISNMKQQRSDPFGDFWSNMDFFGRRGPVSSSGSGVIISADGYIATNNHVVDGADEIEVILNNNKKSFKAKVIGTDPSTDLALLKISGKDLPKINLGNSDNISVGDWVVAVGNPFNLTSTVTAGIVSAKGRNINIVNNQFPIESFIQTDAAINPGNSGGALVDVNGNLVGINTAIASNTGSYNGYGFAIPVNIVAKIIKDLIEHGEVQRGYTGMDVKDIDADLAEKINLTGNAGVYVEQVMEDGPATKGGIEAGDIVVKLDEKIIDSKSQFDEQISLHRPGESIKVSYIRKGKVSEAILSLINKEGNSSILRKYTYPSSLLGADLTPVSKIEKEKLGISNGIKVTNIRGGKLRQMGFQEGGIITKFNNKEYTDPKKLEQAVNDAHGSISIEGINPQGGRFNYNFFGF